MTSFISNIYLLILKNFIVNIFKIFLIYYGEQGKRCISNQILKDAKEASIKSSQNLTKIENFIME